METPAYPKILHIGDKPISDLFDEEVEITEKVDGSQFGFGLVNDELVIRSKGRIIDQDNPDKMFRVGVEYIQSIKSLLPTDTFFYGEYLEKPRHSTLAYDRVPRNNIALFGVLKTNNTLEDYSQIKMWADLLHIDAIPLIYQGVSSPSNVLELMDRVSYLGGQNIEGVVVKRYEQWLFLNRILTPVKAGKYVTEAFKEVHKKDWGYLNTSKGSVERLKENVRTEARWNKAIQHLKEAGEFEGTVRDIGKLVKEIQNDLREEEKENLKDQLWNIYGSDILKSSTNGFVDWYKQEILMGKFENIS